MANELLIFKESVVDKVENKVNKLISENALQVPADYSVGNAMQSAWLLLQNIVDKDKKPVLSTCTKDSIANSLFTMAVSGLNPMKKQCYFIPYKGELTCEPSYFGMELMAKRTDPNISRIISEVVYKGDVFQTAKKAGRTVVSKHETSLDNASGEIIGAYASTFYKDGTEETTTMTMQQIRNAWSQSRTGNQVHNKFPVEMAKKTVLRNHCKNYINASGDSYLINAFEQQESRKKEQRIDSEIQENANKTNMDIDMETGEILDADYQEVEPEMTPEEEAEKIAAEMNEVMSDEGMMF